MHFFNTLSAKLSFTIVFIIMIIMASVTYVFTVRQIESKRREVRENMGRVAKQIASIRLAETEGWYVYQDWIDNIIQSDFSQDIVYIAIFDENDSLAVYSLNYKLLDVDKDYVLSRAQQANIVRQLSLGQVAEESLYDFDRQVVDIRWGNDFLGTVEVGFSLIELNDSLRHSLFVNLLFLTIFSFAGVLASILLSRKITGPLNRLSSAMIRVSRGDLTHKIRVESSDEVGHLAETYNSMIHGLEQKQIIETFSRDLSFLLEIEKVAERVTQQICQSAECDRGILLIRRDQYLLPLWDYPRGSITGIAPLKLKSEWLESTTNWHEPFDSGALKQLSDLEQEVHRLQTQIEMPEIGLIVPLVTKDKVISLLALGTKDNTEAYSEEEKQFIATLARQAVFAIENTMLLEELTEQERLKRELEIARNVQMRLLPQSNPEKPELDVYGFCNPAEVVGGDYYDYFYLGDERLGIAIADVAGKGTSAAFYMAEIKGMMASITKLLDSPKEILSHVNEKLYNTMDRQFFATMIYAIINLKTKEVRFARAGHNALIIKNSRNSSIEFLVPPGMGLGLVGNELFDNSICEENRKLHPRDILIFFTDGISEAMTINFEEFSEERLAQIIENHQTCTMEHLCNKVIENINSFSAGSQQHDDMTMVAVQVKG